MIYHVSIFSWKRSKHCLLGKSVVKQSSNGTGASRQNITQYGKVDIFSVGEMVETNFCSGLVPEQKFASTKSSFFLR